MRTSEKPPSLSLQIDVGQGIRDHEVWKIVPNLQLQKYSTDVEAARNTWYSKIPHGPDTVLGDAYDDVFVHTSRLHNRAIDYLTSPDWYADHDQERRELEARATIQHRIQQVEQEHNNQEQTGVTSNTIREAEDAMIARTQQRLNNALEQAVERQERERDL